MFSIKGLRAKTILSALIPTALVMGVMAIIALYAYERAARDLVQQRDTELARISAARLSEALGQYSRVLQSIAAGEDFQSMEPARLSAALENAQHQLYVFDGGVVVYDSEGVALWSQPFAAERRGTDFPAPSEFDKLRRTLRPAFSDVFRDAISGEDVILVGVPIVGGGGEFKGVLSGMFRMKYPLLGAIYAEVLQLKVGRSGYAYLVDGNGRVIYHPDGSQVGRNLAATPPVMRALRGETGAILTADSTGESIISGFAPVPGTGWALITQERWEDVVGPIRGYGKLLLGLLVLGGVISGALISFAIGRILKPIKDLTQGAQRIAAGDFDHTITARTGDEIQALAQQFNTMASALKESYTNLERRVAERTKELATLNAVAQTVSQSLELETLLCAALDRVLEVLEFESGAIYLRDLETGELQMACYRGLSEPFRRVVARGIISARAAKTGNPIIIDDLRQERDAPREAVEEGYRSIASIPLLSKRQVQGVLTTASRQVRQFRQRDVDLLLSIGHQIGVAIENARLFKAEQRRAEQFRVINQVGRRISSVLDLDELLRAVVRLIKETFGYYNVNIFLVDPGSDELVLKAGVGGYVNGAPPLGHRLKIGEEGILGWIAATGEPLLVNDVSHEPRYYAAPMLPGTRSELGVPIKVRGQVVGTLDVQSTESNAFDEDDLTTLQTLADQVAVAIENARLYEQAQQVATLEERQRLARELHDSVTQALYGVTLYAEAAARRLASGDVEGSADHLQELRETAQEALREMRLLIFELRPPVLEKEGLVAALQARLEAVEGRAGLETEFKVEGKGCLPPEIEEGLYRIAQEALNNVLRHATARRVMVQLRFDEESVCLEVCDDGVGFDPTTAREKGGLGLRGMEERAARLGGRLTVESRPGGGTRVRVSMGTRGNS